MSDREVPGTSTPIGSAPHASLSIVMPVYREEDNIRRAVGLLAAAVRVPFELLIVYDLEDDPTVPIARELAAADPRVRPVRNASGTGRGLLNAVRTGIREARGEAIVITMADVTDDVTAIDRMWALFQEGYTVVAPTRHSRGGRMVGGPVLKTLLSRWGGRTLRWLSGLPTADPTNAFKLWDASFLRATPIESSGGFEYSLELCAKAYLAGRRIAEFPTTWHDRSAGTSKFQLWRWLPRYLAWYGWLVRRSLPARLRGLVAR